MTNFIGGSPYVSLLGLSSSGGSFTVPSTPTSTTAAKTPLSPNFTAGPTGLDPYRPWRKTVLDGQMYIANGFDAPRWWDRTNGIYSYVGSAAPTDFTLALSAAGTPAAIPDGQTARYYLVGYNSTTGKETAPQGGDEYTIANSSGGTRDVTVAWTGGSLPTEFDKRRIYRALYATDDFKLVATVTDATATYLDVTPDASLLTATSWNGAIRTTLPPTFLGLTTVAGLLVGWEAGANRVRFSRTVRVTGTPVVEDFPEENVLVVGSDSGSGAPTAVVAYQRAAIIFKRQAIYETTGFDPSVDVVRCATTARGTFNPDTVVPVDRWLICLDEKGIYKFTPGLYAGALGSTQDMYHSPMQPIIDRLNIGANSLFHSTHLPTLGIVVFWVALDFDPTPGHGIVFDYGKGKFLGLLTARHPTQAGYMIDTHGLLHPCFGDDMGYLWEDVYGEGEGCFSGDNTATVTSGSARSVVASGAAYTTTLQGTLGCPIDRYDSSGTVIDYNRVYATDSTTLTTYYYPSASVTPGDSVAIGIIPAVLETAALSFGTHDEKIVRNIYVEYESGPAGAVRFDTSVNDDSFIRKWEETITSTVQATIPMANTVVRTADVGYFWRLRISQRYANIGFSIRGLHIQWNLRGGGGL